MKVPIVLGSAGVLATVVAADLPFYKEGSAIPSYVPATEGVSTSAIPLDSRTKQSFESEAIAIDSNEGFPRMASIVR